MKPGTKEQAAIYNLDKSEVYEDWRDEKLSNAPTSAQDLLVKVENIDKPDPQESDQIVKSCRNNNMALYISSNHCGEEKTERERVWKFAEHFGLHRVEQHRSMSTDGLVSIEKVDDQQEGRQGFIPYTDKPMSWHTDGYYNPTAVRIKAMMMYCVRPASKGGTNELFDPEIAYIRLRDENPDFIHALTHRRTMVIPAFVENGGLSRPQSVGSVFTWDRYTGNLHMRFTDRKRNIEWADNKLTQEAVAFLRHVLETDKHVIKYKLEAGQGLICNNVLHNRTAFSDEKPQGEGRLLLRARYLDRIEGTC